MRALLISCSVSHCSHGTLTPCPQIAAEKDQSWAFHTVSVLFAVSFTLVRVVGGLLMSYYWWYDALSVIIEGRAHSVPVFVFNMVANLVIMGMLSRPHVNGCVAVVRRRWRTASLFRVLRCYVRFVRRLLAHLGCVHHLGNSISL